MDFPHLGIPWRSLQSFSCLGVSKINPKWRGLNSSNVDQKVRQNLPTILVSFRILRFTLLKELRSLNIIQRSVADGAIVIILSFDNINTCSFVFTTMVT